MKTSNWTRRAAMMLAGTAAAGTAIAKSKAKPEDPKKIGASLAPFACNLDTWFKTVPFKERFALAAKFGFKTVEFWPVNRDDGSTAQSVRALLDANGLALSQYAPTAPAFSDPARHGELLDMIRQAINDAKVLGCSRITVVGHANVAGMSREAMLSGYTAGLMRMAPLLEDAGITALVEPFNTVNHLNFLLNGSRPAASIIRAVKSPAIRILWDFYHMQLEDGDLIEKFTSNADVVGYVQLGDVPGRHQPGSGEVNHINLLKAVRKAGYAGLFGLEYFPLDDDFERAVNEAATLSAAAGLV